MQNARNRMSPHFFFNLLSSISAHIDQPAIKEKLKKVSLLLRKSLENIEQTAIPLEEEIDAVKTFIELQLEKLPEPFSWELIISNEVNMQTLLPAMMIQIPVENSIKHGLMPMQERKGKLIIRVENQDHEMKICIDDNGVGLSASAGNIAGTGTGLKVLLQTIHLLNSKNKNKILLTMNEKKEHPGTRVDISVPFDYSFSI
jgi:LytS/YehU family sensor histidine kinase